MDLVFKKDARNEPRLPSPAPEEGYPHDLQGAKMRSQFLYSATREEVGFSYERPKGKKNCVIRTAVSPVEAS